MKIVIAPDKFKGSLTSLEVCSAITEGILLADNYAEISFFPMADGGDGFADVMKYYTGTITQQVQSVDALGRVIDSTYELNPNNKTAIIELASCSGIAMLQKNERNPLLASSYGTGLQIQHAIGKGIKKIILGIGGSATNDGGTGILGAMGFRFLNGQKQLLNPIGASLVEIREIIPPDVLPEIAFEIACDVTNPLYGPEGAAFIFSPQKGANREQVELLDRGLQNFASVVRAQTGRDISKFAGAGAAGGIAAGLISFLPVSIREGTELVLQAANIENLLKDVDLMITGEGKLDRQSFDGKTISAITTMGNRNKISVIAFCGKLELDEYEWRELGLLLAVEISDGTLTESESMKNAYELLVQKSASVTSLLKEITKKN